MSEITIGAGIGAAIIAAIMAWVLRGARAKTAEAVAEANLVATNNQLADKVRAYEALQSEHTRTTELLRSESERRATAEAVAVQADALQKKLDAKDQLLKEQQAHLSELDTRIEEERKAANDKLKLIVDAEASLSNAFKALSSDALKQNNQSFIDLATATLGKFQETAKGDLEARQKAVDAMVLPIRESLQKVDGKLGEIEKDRLSSYSSLNEQLKGLVETHLPVLRNETANLVKALRQPTTRGRWGELQLKRVVEMAGMLDYCDFLEQENRTTEDGRLRPDMIVKLPGGRNIVVDAKAPVSAYLDALESADEATQRLRLAQHAQQVRSHITTLGRKAYWEQFSPSPEFVVMFLPGEVFFSAALQEDPSIIECGVSEKVIVASPTTLIALLRAVAYGWRQEALAQNAKEVAELGRQLYERIVKLGEHWSNVGDKLGKAVDAYNSATTTLESRVLVSARKLRELKAAPEDVEIDLIEQVDRVPKALQVVLAETTKEGELT
ncbi:MAG TPA: DNA recombination protein RmuC [Steroidobacteraceae bacterium]|nr:DNA recombination protein RmuC [Steroidobacteraceae bacterium]